MPLNIVPPYDPIISTLKVYINSTGKISGSRDRTCHHTEAVIWIQICASFLTITYNIAFHDDDLRGLHDIYDVQDTPDLHTVNRPQFCFYVYPGPYRVSQVGLTGFIYPG